MSFSKFARIGAVILSVLQIVILISGCEVVTEFTNEPPTIIRFRVPVEVEYGETVEFSIAAYDPEDDSLTYSWEVSAGTLIGSDEPEVQWTAPEIPPKEIVPSKVVSVHAYVRDGHEEVSKKASIIAFSKTYKVREALIGTYTLVSKRVHGARVEGTGALQLTATTFTREFQATLDGGIQGPIQLVAGSYKLVDPFGTAHGVIHWLTHGDPTPSMSTYSWENERLVIFFPATSTEYVYTRAGVDPEGDDADADLRTDGGLIEITDETFVAKVLNAELPVVVEFEADWSPFCRQMRPIVDAVAVGARDTFIMAQLDVDENPLTPRAYKVDDIPTYVVFRGGAEISRFAGVMPKPIFVQKILDALK